MKVEELAELLGKSRVEIEEMLKKNDVIELNLNERKAKNRKEDDELRIFE